MTEPTIIPEDSITDDKDGSLGISNEAFSDKDNNKENTTDCDAPIVTQVSPTSDKDNKENTSDCDAPQIMARPIVSLSPTFDNDQENNAECDVLVAQPFMPKVTPEKRKKSYYYSSNYDKQVEQKKRFKRIPCHFFDISYTNYWIHQNDNSSTTDKSSQEGQHQQQ